jgi:hypothetical protein
MTLLMRAERWLAPLLVLVLSSAAKTPAPDQFTPVVASTLTSGCQPFPGTDGKRHVVYELVLTNTSPTPATLKKIEVVDAANPSRIFASYADHDLMLRLRSTGNSAVESPEIEFNNTRLFLIDLAFGAGVAPPSVLAHRIQLLGASAPSHNPAKPVPLSYTIAPFKLSLKKLPEIGPPLIGDRWVAINGCCGVAGVHRSTGFAVNGRISFAQRFAIDWMRLDDKGRMVHGDPADVHNYASYGADVLAVADGKVVSTLNDLDDQVPGKLPDPKTINIENVDGNHVVLDLGNGVFAFYAHMQKHSITVAPGDRVKRGQVLGQLGNTGNSSAPHLHFHLMDGPSVLGSSGIPYVIDSFAFAGQIPEEKFAAAPGVEGDWSEGLLHTPSSRDKQFPMDLTIADFAGKR